MAFRVTYKQSNGKCSLNCVVISTKLIVLNKIRKLYLMINLSNFSQNMICSIALEFVTSEYQFVIELNLRL